VFVNHNFEKPNHHQSTNPNANANPDLYVPILVLSYQHFTDGITDNLR